MTANFRPERKLRASAGTPLVVLSLFSLYVIAWFLQISYRVEWLGAVRFDFVLGAVLSLIAIALLAKRPLRAGREGNRIRLAALILLAILSLMTFASVDPVASWPIYVERVIKFSFMSVFIVAFVRSPQELKWFIAAFLIACGYICQESFRGALSGGMVWENQGVPRLHGETPMFRHPNSLGGLALGVVPFCYFLGTSTSNWKHRLALAVLATIALAVVVYTGSRTAYIGAFVLLAYILIRSGLSLPKMIFASIAALAVLAVLVPDIYKSRLETVVTGQEIEGRSMDTRRLILYDSVDVFFAHPYGVGVAGFPVVRQNLFGRVQDTHNLYLQIATNLGVQGLVAFFALVGLIWVALSRLIRELSVGASVRFVESGQGTTVESVDDSVELLAEGRRRFLLAVALSTQAYLLVRLVLGLFGHDLYEIYWWIVLGLTLALLEMCGRGQETVVTPRQVEARFE